MSSFRVENGGEPIPGYRLVERLGGGGFGEVWKCEAPGGIMKAIKLVFGNLLTAGEDEVRARQELKALNRVKDVRHPYILSLERYDIVNGQLYIVMELADRNLWDRFRECRTQNLLGIPRPELLRYMEEIAEALDLMNHRYNLQHLDIKPQNLFLVYNHVKVADFGLVKDLEGMRGVVTGGITPVYAAPETFDGSVTRFCDQYSLAIVYHELLTGRRPFSGSNVQQLIMQHLTAEPNLELLPPGEREVIARSLAKDPEERYPTCGDMVRALIAAEAGGVAPSSAPPLHQPQAPPSTQSSASGHVPSTLPGPAQPAQPSPPAAVPLPLPFPDTSKGTTTSYSQPPGAPDMGISRIISDVLEPSQAPLQPPPERIGEGVLFPALVMGIGGVGRRVLHRLRLALNERSGSAAAMPHLKLLYIETDPEMVRDIPAAASPSAEVGLVQSEVLLTPLKRPMHYLKHGRSRHDDWIDPKLIQRIHKGQPVTAGLRPYGRLAFVDNHRALVHRVQQEIKFITDPEVIDKAVHQTRLGLRSNRPRIYMIAGLGGGTGGGMFLDMAYLLRHLLKHLGYEKPDVVGMLMLPRLDPTSSRQEQAQANAYASLVELNHFSQAKTTFVAQYDENERVIKDSDPPLTRSYLFPLPPEERGLDPAADTIVAQVAHFLCRDMTSPLGRITDTARNVVIGASPSGTRINHQADQPRFLSFGLSRYTWPRRLLLRMVAGGLGARLVEGWTGNDRGPVRDKTTQTVDAEWPLLELDPDGFADRLQKPCVAKLGKSPEAAFAEILGPLEAAAKPTSSFLFRRTPDLEPGAVRETLDKLEQLLGRPEGSSGTGTRRNFIIPEQLAIGARPIQAEGEKRIAKLIERTIDTPGLRLASAEELLTQLNTRVDTARLRFEQRYEELEQEGLEKFNQLTEMIEKLEETAGAGQRTNAMTPGLMDLIRGFPKIRFQGLLAKQIIQCCNRLQSFFADQVREIDTVRNRLREIHATMSGGGAMASFEAANTFGHSLLPNMAATLDEASDQVLSEFSPQELNNLDQKVQSMVKSQFNSLHYVCQAGGVLLKNLEKGIQQEAETLAGTKLVDLNVVEMFLKRYTLAEEVRRTIRQTYHESTPLLAGGGHSSQRDDEVRILGVPVCADTETFRSQVAAALPGITLTPATSQEDILIYREVVGLKLSEIEQTSPEAKQIYQQVVDSQSSPPHSRQDIENWLPLR